MKNIRYTLAIPFFVLGVSAYIVDLNLQSSWEFFKALVFASMSILIAFELLDFDN